MTMLNRLLAAAIVPAAAVAIVPIAQAQVAGVAVADPEGAIAATKAWTNARNQIQTTYKPQLDQAAARERAITAELQPLVTAFQTAQARPNADQNALRTQAQQIQTRQQAGQTELQRLQAPAARAQAYALEQISAQLRQAVNTAVQKKRVSLLLRPNAALFAQPSTDITADITAELDRLVPSVNINPPANWQPGQQPAAAGTAPAPAPTPAPQGR